MSGPRERLLELLAERALFGLDAPERAELARLLAEYPDVDPDELDRLAADAARSALPEDPEPLPPALRDSILARAPAHLPAPGRRRFAGAAGWLTAAAAVLFAAGVMWWSRPAPEPTPAEARLALLARAADLVRLEWTATDDPAGRGAGGDVVWSPSEQRGYMRFTGLAANDPAREQYQLWIFDAERDERYPVDGGVFDVTAGEVVVPIRARVPVRRLAMFAVTVEPPGGVVVSTRARLPLLAKVAG